MDPYAESSSRPTSGREELLSEQSRLNTFKSWPHSAAVGPQALAKAGFYYLGQADRVRCAFCGGTLKSWQSGDDPATEHKKYFGQCPYVLGQNVGNTPLSVPQAPSASGANGLDIGPEEVPANLRLNPRNPDYHSMDSRKSSYVDWPPEIAQRPSALVDAGFFYTGHGDGVRCFCCDGTLRNWEPADDPWVEHALWFPRCPYLLQQKGLGFVRDIQGRQAALHKAQCPRMSPQQSPLTARRELEQDPAMSSEMVKQVLGMGFDRRLVQTTLQQLRFSSGGQLPGADQLINALLSETGNPGSHGLGEGTGSQASAVSITGLPPHAQSGEASSQGAEVVGSDRVLCKICMDREVAVTFLPCGHLVCCAECSKHVKQCPVCRQTVRASIRTYLC